MAKKKENKGGRPPKYKTAQELEDKILEYFDKGVAIREVITGPPNNREVSHIRVPTITGLVLYCGFCDRASFYDQEKRSDEFSHTIKNARTRIENEYEEILQTVGGSGAIFALKNFGWKDKTEHELSGQITVMEKIKINGKPMEIDIGD